MSTGAAKGVPGTSFCMFPTMSPLSLLFLFCSERLAGVRSCTVCPSTNGAKPILGPRLPPPVVRQLADHDIINVAQPSFRQVPQTS